MKRLTVVALSVFALWFAAHPIALQAQAGKAAKSMTASGMVKSVSASSLTIAAAGGKDLTFAVDSTTKFVGKGLGTKSAAGKLTATSAVAMNDRVRVTYRDMGGALHAENVRVDAKAPATKK